MCLGWSFIWLGKRSPAYITPCGCKVIILVAEGDIPYVYETNRPIDIRDPIVRQKVGIGLEGNKIVVDIDCPYNQDNPPFEQKQEVQDTCVGIQIVASRFSS